MWSQPRKEQQETDLEEELQASTKQSEAESDAPAEPDPGRPQQVRHATT